MLSLDRVYAASNVLKKVIRKTDMIAAPKINPSANVYLKTENLQALSKSEALISKSASSPMKKRKRVLSLAQQAITLRALLSHLPKTE